jgi:DNA-binding HxlR family transcriptional regulator
MRCKELKSAIPDISQKMLTWTLRQLESDHLVIRKAYAEIPPRVEYSLTEMGLSLMPVIRKMVEWAQEHSGEVIRTDIFIWENRSSKSH